MTPRRSPGSAPGAVPGNPGGRSSPGCSLGTRRGTDGPPGLKFGRRAPGTGPSGPAWRSGGAYLGWPGTAAFAHLPPAPEGHPREAVKRKRSQSKSSTSLQGLTRGMGLPSGERIWFISSSYRRQADGLGSKIRISSISRPKRTRPVSTVLPTSSSPTKLTRRPGFRGLPEGLQQLPAAGIGGI